MAVIDAHEKRDTMTMDILDVFIQTLMPNLKDDEKVTMKNMGILVDILVNMSPDTYKGYVVIENGPKVLYMQVLQAIYGMLQSALLWYDKFRMDLEEEGFWFNPYHLCVANC